MKDVTIVLPVCLIDQELIDSTSKCANQLADNTPRNLYDLVLIENGSLAVGIQDFDLRDDVTYIRTANPLGAARPFNMGVALARTRYAVFMSNDVYVTPGWLEGLLTAYQKHGSGIVAPEETAGRPDWTPNAHWGACFLTERSLWESMGGWDEVNFPWRYCDQDMSIRMTKLGFHVGRTGLSVVEHKNMLTVNKMQDIIAPHAARERERMLELYGAAEFDEWIRLRTQVTNG